MITDSSASDLVNCRNQEYTGINHDGGYAEVMIAKSSSLMGSLAFATGGSSATANSLLAGKIQGISRVRPSLAKQWRQIGQQFQHGGSEIPCAPEQGIFRLNRELDRSHQGIFRPIREMSLGPRRERTNRC